MTWQDEIHEGMKRKVFFLKKYFNLTQPYQFELNDIFSVANFINVILVINFGLVASWFGLLIAVTGICDDIINIRKLNLIFLHFSVAILNTYFLLMFYKII